MAAATVEATTSLAEGAALTGTVTSAEARVSELGCVVDDGGQCAEELAALLGSRLGPAMPSRMQTQLLASSVRAAQALP